MKKLIALFISMLVIPITILAVPQEVGPEGFKFSIEFIIALIMGIYELLVRLIPTYKHWSVIGKILEILLWISKFLNVEKKKLSK